jgi:hypothetical protein
VLLIQDVHIVAGRDELLFEDAYRTELAVPGDGVRLAMFAWAPHGSGEGYEAVILTLVDDVTALARWQDRLATGDLAEAWLALQSRTHSSVSTCYLLADGSPLATRDLTMTTTERPPNVLRLEIFQVADAIAAAVEQILEQPARDDDVLVTEAVWTPFLGDLATAEVAVLSRVTSAERLHEALANGEPKNRWSGAPAIGDSLGSQTRLLRSVGWSAV